MGGDWNETREATQPNLFFGRQQSYMYRISHVSCAAASLLSPQYCQTGSGRRFKGWIEAVGELRCYVLPAFVQHITMQQRVGW